MQIDREVLKEVEAAWPAVLTLIREYDEAFPYAAKDGDDETVYRMSQALASLRKAMEDAQDAADAQKALDELICECGMTGPCMYSECKSPLLSCKAMEDGKDG